jgi:hypothetical protein
MGVRVLLSGSIGAILKGFGSTLSGTMGSSAPHEESSLHWRSSAGKVSHLLPGQTDE